MNSTQTINDQNRTLEQNRVPGELIWAAVLPILSLAAAFWLVLFTPIFLDGIGLALKAFPFVALYLAFGFLCLPARNTPRFQTLLPTWKAKRAFLYPTVPVIILALVLNYPVGLVSWGGLTALSVYVWIHQIHFMALTRLIPETDWKHRVFRMYFSFMGVLALFLHMLSMVLIIGQFIGHAPNWKFNP